MTLVSVTLSMCAFWRKLSFETFHDAAFFAHEIVDDCFLVPGPALADAGPNARPGRGAQCKT